MKSVEEYFYLYYDLKDEMLKVVCMKPRMGYFSRIRIEYLLTNTA